MKHFHARKMTGRYACMMGRTKLDLEYQGLQAKKVQCYKLKMQRSF